MKTKRRKPSPAVKDAAEFCEKAKAIKRLLAERGVKTGRGKRNDTTSATVAEVSAELGGVEDQR